MKHLSYEMPGSYEHHFPADYHVYVNGFNEKRVHRYFKKNIMSKKNATFGSMGDLIDTMNPMDSRFKFDAQDPKYAKTDSQMDFLIEMLKPYQDRCLYIGEGNHEYRVWNTINVAKKIAEGLEADYATFTAKIDFGSFKVLDWHGFGAVNSRAGDMQQRINNERLMIKRKLRDVGGVHDCDVAIMHHIHKSRIAQVSCDKDIIMVSNNGKLKASYPKPSRIWIDKKKGTYYIPEDDRWYGSSGAFFQGYVEGFSTYIESRGYRPTEMAMLKMVVKNDRLQGLEKVIL